MKPTTALKAEAALSPKEHKQLERLEGVLAQLHLGFWDMGKIYREIRAGRLYRPMTWDNYCLKRWEVHAHRAEQLIYAADIMDNLDARRKKAKGQINLPLPTNDSQVRQLVNLDPDTAWQVWQAVVQAAGKRRPTAELVAKQVEALTGKPAGAGPGEISEVQAGLIDSLAPDDRRKLLEETEKEAASGNSGSSGGGGGGKGEPEDGQAAAVRQINSLLDRVGKLIDRLDCDRDAAHERLGRLRQVVEAG